MDPLLQMLGGARLQDRITGPRSAAERRMAIMQAMSEAMGPGLNSDYADQPVGPYGPYAQYGLQGDWVPMDQILGFDRGTYPADMMGSGRPMGTVIPGYAPPDPWEGMSNRLMGTPAQRQNAEIDNLVAAMRAKIRGE